MSGGKISTKISNNSCIIFIFIQSQCMRYDWRILISVYHCPAPSHLSSSTRWPAVSPCLRVSGVHWCPLVSTGVSADEFSHDKARLGLFTSRGQTSRLEHTGAAVPDTSTNLSWADRKQKGFILQWADHAGTKCAAQTLTSEISRQTLVSRSPQKHLELITIKWLVKNVSVL